MTSNAWIMRVNAVPGKMQFDLEGALHTSVLHDRTIWLKNGQFNGEIRVEDRVYLWSSGVKNADRSIGRLVASTTVVRSPTKHAQHDWQSAFRRREDYDPSAIRLQLGVDDIVNPPVRRSEVMLAYPKARTETAFFRNGHIQTMARLDPTIRKVLSELVLDRCSSV